MRSQERESEEDTVFVPLREGIDGLYLVAICYDQQLVKEDYQLDVLQ